VRSAPELAPLVDDYRRALMAYLQRRENAAVVSPVIRREAFLRGVSEDTLKLLDALDARRESLRPRKSDTLQARTSGD